MPFKFSQEHSISHTANGLDCIDRSQLPLSELFRTELMRIVRYPAGEKVIYLRQNSDRFSYLVSLHSRQNITF